MDYVDPISPDDVDAILTRGFAPIPDLTESEEQAIIAEGTALLRTRGVQGLQSEALRLALTCEDELRQTFTPEEPIIRLLDEYHRTRGAE